MKTVKQLREERNAVVTAMNEILKRAEGENRGFNPEEDSAWTKALADIEAIDKRMERAETIERLGGAAPNVRHVSVPGGESVPQGEEKPEQRTQRIFRTYLIGGIEALSGEERQEFRASQQRLMASLSDAEKRAFAAGTSNVGGATVPQGFYATLEQALKATGAMWGTSEIISTDRGTLMPYPTFNYTGVSATIVGEGSAGSLDSSTPFGAVNLNAYTYRSPILPVSIEFLDDTAFDESFLVRGLTESIARGTNAHFSTGTGSGQPLGIATTPTVGKTGTTGQTTSVIYDDLVEVVHSVDAAYRVAANVSMFDSKAVQGAFNKPGPTVGWMLRDTSVAVIRKIKDGQNMPIWKPAYEAGVTTGVPDTLLGYPVYINNDIPAMAANAYSIGFGRLDKYKIRMVKDFRILRLTERYADNLQVAFIMFLRADGKIVDAGTNPIKFYRNSAT